MGEVEGQKGGEWPEEGHSRQGVTNEWRRDAEGEKWPYQPPAALRECARHGSPGMGSVAKRANWNEFGKPRGKQGIQGPRPVFPTDRVAESGG